MAGSVLGEAWVDRLVAASAGVEPAGARSAVVAVTIGKAEQAVLQIADGRVVGPGDEAAIDLTIPTTAEQLAAFADGSESLARSYMRGDVKPVGSTGALLALVELLEAPEVRAALAP